MNSIELIFSGDLCPTGRIEQACLQNLHKEAISGIAETFRETDLHITNLECPLTLSNAIIDKSGPALKARPETLNLLKSLNVGLACLANNHIRDYGHVGVMDTIELCHANKIATVGAGKNQNSAGKITYLELKGRTLAFLNYCEQEFSLAGRDYAGANPIDPIQAWYDIAEALKITPLVFVILHGGHEEYALPSPRIRKLFHYIADLGAAAVIGHHPHVVSGIEHYKGKPLVYSLGNFIFDEPENNFVEWHIGALALISIKPDNTVELKMKYISQGQEVLGIKFLTGEKLSEFEKRVSQRSGIIADEFALAQSWNDFANQHQKGMIKQILCFNKIQRALYKFGLLKSILIQKKEILPQLNIVQCESHRDLIIYSLRNQIK